MKTFPIMPLVSLFISALLFAIGYSETDNSEKFLIASFMVTLVTSFVYWIIPCPENGNPRRQPKTRTVHGEPQTQRLSANNPSEKFPSPEESHALSHNGLYKTAKSLGIENKSGNDFDKASSTNEGPLSVDPKKVAVLVYKRSPEIQFLHLDPSKWCMALSEDGNPMNALKKISKLTNIGLDEFKLEPRLVRMDNSINATYMAAEVPNWVRINLKPDEFEWLGVEHTLNRAKDCGGLLFILQKFSEHLYQEKPQWEFDESAKTQEPYEIANLLDEPMKRELGAWYKQSEEEHLILSLLQKKKPKFQVDIEPLVVKAKMPGFSWPTDINGKYQLGDSLAKKTILICVFVPLALVILGGTILGVYYYKPELFNFD